MAEGRFGVKGIIINLFVIAFLFQVGMVMESWAGGDDQPCGLESIGGV